MIKSASLISNVHLTRRNPVSLVHFVTNRCNARCSFCFIDFDDPETFRGEMSIDEIDTFTRTLGPSLQNVNLTGGEPFARKELLDIARAYFRNTDIRSIFITSNGSLPERMIPFARTLMEEFPDRKVIFSLSIDSFADEHDRIRKIDGLFEKCMASYHGLVALGGNAMANIAITVSHENHQIVLPLYEHLVEERGIKALTATIVRDEGVYRIPIEHKKEIAQAYATLTRQIQSDLRGGRLNGYDIDSLQGRLMNKKNVIVNKIISDTYVEPKFVSPCHAGTLFGVIEANGLVRPCEVLDRNLGNLRDHNYDFQEIWQSQEAKDLSAWIKASKCNCTYECAWSFNVLGNARYQPALMAAALGKYW
ncbi:MAG TPA: hypothetical protein DCG48_12510 [Rhodospirillaceae bacterium]|nr:hypothetical protein [Rhodospirillaceae bacterium]|tara:strand:- start:10295 stop:11386 length:1092 start_codon:yes stop_codon:yes gene_type:complete